MVRMNNPTPDPKITKKPPKGTIVEGDCVRLGSAPARVFDLLRDHEEGLTAVDLSKAGILAYTARIKEIRDYLKFSGSHLVVYAKPEQGHSYCRYYLIAVEDTPLGGKE